MNNDNYGLTAAVPQGNSVTMLETSVGNREVAKVKAQVFMAKQFPRNEVSAMNKILASCKRPALATNATYSFPRGNQTVTGPSIRLAEVIIQNWGNADFGFTELQRIPSQGKTPGKSTVEAYAWDLETNTRRSTTFDVYHIRDTRNGAKLLTEERDIYEMIANQASRRMRGCILQLVPGDIVDAALEECENTMKGEMSDPAKLKANIARIIKGFASMEITESMLVKYLKDKRSTQWTPDDLRELIKVATAIKEGHSTPADYFEEARKTQKINDSQRTELMQLAKANHKAAIEAIKPLGFETINSITIDSFEKAKELIAAAVSPQKQSEESEDDHILAHALDGK